MSVANLLIIDDDESFRRVWGHILTRAGYGVTIVPDVPRAREYLQSHTPDVILCDVNLPGVDGPSFCRDLRKSPRTRNIPVVMISAVGDDIRRKMSHDCCANGYLEKPFRRSELLSVLHKILVSHREKTKEQSSRSA